jgi:aminodeoxyfutalosine synthase
MNLREGLQALKNYGLDSIPGGGAEIFDEEIRQKVCPHKDTGEEWLKLHKTAHELGIPTNATILYGHIENIEHRIDHFNRLRELQDQTGGFNVFIPLKYKKENNELSYLGEVSVVEDIRLYAMSRIFLDNFNHIKAYWPMIGKDISQLLLSFGVDDFDGTINDSTKIYSLAGAEDQAPSMNTNDMVKMIEDVGRKAIERDSVYNILKEF